MSGSVSLVEMGARDGLQNEKVRLDVATKVEMITRLAQTGLPRIEIGAFVRADWVPQMADSAAVVHEVLQKQKKGKIPAATRFSVLVPNEKGMQFAIEAGLKEVAVFAASSESFSQKNINCSIDESFARFTPVLALARKHQIKVRGYLSTCFGCPFEGDVPVARVVKLARRMDKLGVHEISLGDTIGVAGPGEVETMLKKIGRTLPVRKLAGHFHDTRGQSLANIFAAWKMGMRTFDSSVGGLGGCPYAPGAAGNVATEDVVYMLESMGVRTCVNLDGLVAMNPWVRSLVKRDLPSKVGRVGHMQPLGAVTPKSRAAQKDK